jgi:hypothetical protein
MITAAFLIGAVILWAFLQRAIVEGTGEASRTRGSLKGQRRKARRMGMEFDGVPYQHRRRPVASFRLAREVNLVLLIVTGLFFALVFGDFIF